MVFKFVFSNRFLVFFLRLQGKDSVCVGSQVWKQSFSEFSKIKGNNSVLVGSGLYDGNRVPVF